MDEEQEEISTYSVTFPPGAFEIDRALPRGTQIEIRMVVRVRSVQIVEDRRGNLTRKHVFALEDWDVLDVLTPAQKRELAERAMAEAERAEQEEQAPEAPPAVVEQKPRSAPPRGFREDGQLIGQISVDEALADATDDRYVVSV